MKLSIKNMFSDKKFNKLVIAIALPIIIQNGITNLVNMLDNIMIGQLSTEAMSGVAIVNQLMFVFNLCIFGAISGAGIFTAQFFGRGDENGMRHTVRYKIITAALAVTLFIGAFLIFSDQLISLYISIEASESDPVLTRAKAHEYLNVVILQMPFFAISQVYASTLREMNQTKTPMVASIVAFGTNLIGNLILIFGFLFIPALGVTGAAIATVIARIAESAVIIIYSHSHTKEYPVFKSLYKFKKIPADLSKRIFAKGSPILINETVWAVGIALLAQIYSRRGLDVVAAYNIASTINNLFSVVLHALGSAVAIIIGNYLGSGRTEEAVIADTKLIFFSVLTSLFIGVVLAVTSSLFPALYNTTDNIKDMAATFITIYACFMPVLSFINCTYFTLRSGGKTFISLLFDAVFEICVSVPVAIIFVSFTSLPATAIFAIVHSVNVIKIVAGFILLRKKVWLNDLTKYEE